MVRSKLEGGIWLGEDQGKEKEEAIKEMGHEHKVEGMKHGGYVPIPKCLLPCLQWDRVLGSFVRKAQKKNSWVPQMYKQHLALF